MLRSINSLVGNNVATLRHLSLVVEWCRFAVRTLAVLAILAFVVISALVSIHPEWFAFVRSVPGRDKLLHCLGVGLLAVTTVLGFSPPESRSRRRRPLLVLAAIALLVTLEEFGQLAIPTRAFDLADLAWSYTGMALFGLPVVWLMRLRLRRTGQKRMP